MANQNPNQPSSGTQNPIDPSQVKVATDLSNAISSINAQVEAANNRLNRVSKTLEKISSSTKSIDLKPITSLDEKIKSAGEQAQKTNNVNLGGLSKQLEISSAATAAMELKQQALGQRTQKTSKLLTFFGKGLIGMGAMAKTATNLMFSLGKSIGNIGLSILAIPLHLFNAFVNTANKAGGGSSELAEAIEKMRGEFGKLSGPGPKTIMNMATSMKGFEATGLSAFSVFGNLAKRIQDFTALAVALGPAFNNFRKEFDESGGAILGYQKGLGLSDEEMRTVADTAQTMGKTLKQVLEPIRAQAQNLGDQFGIDSKLISRDMARAMKDLKHFAGATNKEIAAASVYARKLGLELDKITGTLDAFETFDTAAENASKLSQAFGVNIDAFKMMEAQDPASQVEMLRKQFAGAGVDASKFNRQQIKLLASSVNLDEATARQVFSLKNQGMSLDQIKKKAEGNEKKQLSQAEAMKALADNIQRLVQTMSSSTGGFFSRFFKGIWGGIQGSQEFIKILNNINRGLMAAEMAGVRLGRALVKTFPGFKGMLEGVADFFNPKKYSNFFGGISKAVLSIKTGSIDEMKNFKTQIDAVFFDFFNASKSSGKKIYENFKIFGKVIFMTLMSAGKFILQEIVRVKDFIVDQIKKPGPELLAMRDWLGSMFQKAADFINTKAVPYIAKALDTITEFLRDPSKGLPKGGDFERLSNGIFGPLIKALQNAWKVLSPRIRPLIQELVLTIIDMMWESFKAAPFKLQALIAMRTIGPALGSGLLGLAKDVALKKSMDKLGQEVAKQAAGKVAAAGAEVVAKQGLEAGAQAAAKAAAAAGATAGTQVVQATGTGLAAAAPAATSVVVGALGVVTAGVVGAIAGWKIGEAIGEAFDKRRDALKDNTSKEVDGYLKGIQDEINPEEKAKKIGSEIDRSNTLIADIIKEKGLEDAKKDPVYIVYQNYLTNLDAQNKGLARQAKEAGGFQELHKQLLKNREDQKLAADRQKMLDDLGPVTIENAMERFKKIDELAKKVMSKDFDIESTMNSIREKLSKVNFALFPDDKADKALEINKTLSTLDSIRLLVATLSDLGVLVLKAKTEINKIQFIDKNNKSFGQLGESLNFIHDIMAIFGAPPDDYDGPKKPPIDRNKVVVVTGTMEVVKTLVDIMRQASEQMLSAKKVIDNLPPKSEVDAMVTHFGDSLNIFTTEKLDIIPDVTLWKYATVLANMQAIYTSLNLSAVELQKTAGIKFPATFEVAFSISQMNQNVDVITSQPTDVLTKLENYIKLTFNVMSMNSLKDTIISASKSMSEVTSTSIVNPEKLTEFSSSVEKIAGTLTNLAGTLTKLSSVQFPADIGFVGSIIKLNQQVTEVVSQPTTAFLKLSDYLYQSFSPDVVTKVQNSINDASAVAFMIGTAITDSNIQQNVQAISEMITKINQINQLMNQLPNIEPKKLQLLADKLGMKGTLKTEINTPPVVIKLSLNVTMSASALEKAMVLNASSIIRDRLNYSTENSAKPGQDTLPTDPDTNFSNPLKPKGG